MKNSQYKDVFVYAYMEHMHYHRISDDGVISDDIAEYDDNPQIKGWNLYGCDGMIDVTLEFDTYPELDDVRRYIDIKLKELK